MSEIRQSTNGPHSAALAIVIAAFALLLLRPFCDLTFAAADRAHAAPAATMAGHRIVGHAEPGIPLCDACCSIVSDGTLVYPAEPLVLRLPGAPLGAALFLLAGLPLFASWRYSARFYLAAPPERPFYARSARILR